MKVCVLRENLVTVVFRSGQRSFPVRNKEVPFVRPRTNSPSQRTYLIPCKSESRIQPRVAIPRLFKAT